jgi:hypothetical protein
MHASKARPATFIVFILIIISIDIGLCLGQDGAMHPPEGPTKRESSVKKTPGSAFQLACLSQGQVADRIETLRLTRNVLFYAPPGPSRWRE